ncbi:hypothetical protein BKA62DRAFT_717387 [Auriculariales sp. MPI-PUGE-AT-0066]|nr:hypothetical protein BKA62DRAFT_717387 [Auriculariales sp. MPI-PUGE-AT-0066]
MLRRRHFVPALLAISGIAIVLYLFAPTEYEYDPEKWDSYWRGSGHKDIAVGLGHQRSVQASCDRCAVVPEFCAQVGSRNLDLVSAYEGSGDRIRRVLAKAARGEPIVYGIIGGSLSRGHGCHCTTFHRQIFDWINATWPHEGHRYVDGSVGARGSNYFKFCHIEHLPQDADIVVLELSLNDEAKEDHAKNLESMLRAILMYPNKPAVLMLASFSLMGQLKMGGDAHLSVAQYYDVPVLNLRHALLPVMQRRPAAVDEFFVIESPAGAARDQLHLNLLGPHYARQFATAYLARQKCQLSHPQMVMEPQDAKFVETERYSDSIPRLALMNDKWSTDGRAMVERPSCASIDSVANPLQPLPSTKGWTKWQQPHTDKHYWRATEPGARFEYTVSLTQGHVMLYYLRSTKMSLGRVKCWLNDDVKNAVVIDGYWERTTSIGQFTALREQSKGPLQPGDYTLRCENMERHYGKEEGRGTTFLIIAVLTV